MYLQYLITRNSDAWINLGTAYGQRNDLNLHSTVFVLPWTLPKRVMMSWLNLRLAQLDLNRVEDAKISFQSCIDLNGDFAEEAKELLLGLG